MPQTIRIWEVQESNTLIELSQPQINREDRLEQWLESNISMVADDYLVIGRQVRTDFDGYIDLLCMDSRGDLVVIELKRGKTPRDVTAQSLDYASWVRGLSSDRVTEIAGQYLGVTGPLEKAFQTRFGEELPEILNENHRIMIVAERMDDSTERIVSYLSDLGVGINVATVQYFRASGGQEMLAQVFLIEPTKAEARSQATSKRRPYLSYDQLEAIAEEKGVITLYTTLVNNLERMFDQKGTTVSSVGFRGRFGNSIKVIFSLIPGSSDTEQGLHFQVYAHRLAEYLHIDLEKVRAMLPKNHGPWTYWPNHPPDAPQASVDDASGYSGYFNDVSEAQLFVDSIEEHKGAHDNR